MPRAIVIRAAGTNCDAEMARAFELAGAPADLVHLDALIRDPSRLGRYGLIGLPGGFSYGDDVASGRVFAMKVRERLWGPMREAVERGCMVIGACNGFQVLVQVGLLPGPKGGGGWPTDRPPAQEVALTDNAGGRFVSRWVGVTFDPASVCVWTRGLLDAVPPEAAGDVSVLPVAHGEGRFVAPPEVLDRLERTGRVAVRYAENFNGSAGAVAGICDESGRVLGLMPHPERYLEWTRHPYWTRLPRGVREGVTPGLAMFRNAVSAAALAERGSLTPA
ncbi:MAG: phosphoribosylformylglycinamidine synthase subunit PurQ [Phycisphaeraceae bacterium]|nr:MAG: phosphoribosylformylglycinamidine synthase subunit PurQ [Phycisphaeraceae bacterium]